MSIEALIFDVDGTLADTAPEEKAAELRSVAAVDTAVW